MLINPVSPYRERNDLKLIIWNGRKATFFCDQCEKCNSTEISQIRFRGDDDMEIYMSNSYLPISGKVMMRCKDHRVSNDTVEIETIYHPNYTEMNYGWERRRIQAPPIQENVISHSPGRDSIIFDKNDFAWVTLK
jgi:hypothetical protein